MIRFVKRSSPLTEAFSPLVESLRNTKKSLLIPGVLLNKGDGGLTLRFLPGVVQQLKMPPRANTKSHFRHPRADMIPHFDSPRANK